MNPFHNVKIDTKNGLSLYFFANAVHQRQVLITKRWRGKDGYPVQLGSSVMSSHW
jgi:hypothetical protein